MKTNVCHLMEIETRLLSSIAIHQFIFGTKGVIVEHGHKVDFYPISEITRVELTNLRRL